jgi:hypothetical protein
MVMQMSIAPFEAQKRAENLGQAESAAVTFAATNEGTSSFTDLPSNCDLSNPTDGSFTVTCVVGEGTKYVQTVSRSFRSEVDAGSLGFTGDSNMRVYPNATPEAFEPHQCPAEDPWGVQYTNDRWKKQWNWGACTPAPLWNKTRYLESNPDDWLYDISGFGFGAHPDY